jgi:hypothetical protein
MPRILAGCVAENTPLFFRRALNLVRSIRWFGGGLAEADIVVCMVEEVRPEYREGLEAAGARVHVVPRWPENRMFNKVQMLTVPGLDAYDCVCVLDCDLIVVQDPTPFLRPGVVQSKIADVDSVPYATFARLCERFGLPLPPATHVTTVDRVPTLRYCNNGVLFGPPGVLKALLVPWKRYELELAADPSLLGRCHHHRQQASFALAMIEQPVAFEELPVALNFPLNHAHRPTTPEMAACDPVIVHYHEAMDELGYLLPVPYPRVQDRVRLFNARLAAEGRRSAGPMLFGVGSGRSGTTLLRMMLDSHPQLAVPPETHFIPHVARACRLAADPARHFVDAIVGHERWLDFGLDGGRFRERVAEIQPFDVSEALRAFYQLYAERFGKGRWGDKSPIYALHVEQIEELLPEARFVQVIRDGRDVALSFEDTWFGPRGTESLAAQWVSRVEAVRRRAHRLRHYLEIRYEDLIENTEAVLRRVCDFLELPWDPAMLSYHTRAEERMAEMARPFHDAQGTLLATPEQRMMPFANLKRPPDAARIGRWRREMTEERQREFEAVAGPLLKELGYEVRHEAAGAPGRARVARVAVCVAGMHRSGTSAIAGLLHASGVLLGDRGSFLDPAADNPAGFWEDRRFVALNEAILRAQGGGWDVPPELAPGWERGNALLALRVEAAALLESRAVDPAGWWGFKDPRATLTYPFWKLLDPHLRLVVCLRNPLEVAHSLTRRNGTSIAFGLRLWERYHRALCAATTPEQRLLVRYDGLQREAPAELRRVLEWLGVPASAEVVAAACTQVTDRLRHHHATPEDLVASEASDSLVSLYLDLCREAAGDGGAPEPAELEVAQVLGTTTREQYRAALRQVRAGRELAERTQEVAALEAENAAVREQVAAEQARSRSLAAAGEERAREQAGHYAALVQHAAALSAVADLRLRQLADMERHALAVEAVLQRQRLRVLLLRIFRFGRQALQRLAGENAQS